MCQGQRPRQVGPSDSGRCGGLGACYDSSIGILAVADRLLHLKDQVWKDVGCLSMVRHREAGGLKDQDSRMDGQPHRDRGVYSGRCPLAARAGWGREMPALGVEILSNPGGVTEGCSFCWRDYRHDLARILFPEGIVYFYVSGRALGPLSMRFCQGSGYPQGEASGGCETGYLCSKWL